ncbi:MAG: type II/IV secretion system protein [Myxococcales bacterium]|nr:type II/IV secretion system protein [Myxococcales bacterium]
MAPTLKGSFTVRFLLDVLTQQHVLSASQAQVMLMKEETQRLRVLKQKGLSTQTTRYDVSPVEIIASFHEELADGQELTEHLIMQYFAEAIEMPFEVIDPLKLDYKLITQTLSPPFAKKHIVVPLRVEGNVMLVAMDNPFDIMLVESLRSLTQMPIQIVLAAKSDILKIITEVYGFRRSVTAAVQDLGHSADLGNLEQLVKLKAVQEIEANDKHIINAVEYLLHYAFDQRASDIHIEPKRNEAVIRFRIDGVLHTVYAIPKAVQPAIVSRIKTLARLDIAEKRKPQDGRIKTDQGTKEVELRISTLPVAFGEKIVIRIFDPEVILQDLDKLGFFPAQLEVFQSFISRPFGMILVTGPTGSGKTTTLYSALNVLASGQVNITTIEDPIEMVIENFNQTNINPKIGLTFASSLRTILRQDPDIIMVGEIRDKETAENAIQAALTGHLVFSTLHTNDAPSTLTRLLDLGIPPFLIGSSLAGVMAQRLVRQICPHCIRDGVMSKEQRELLQIEVPPGRPPFLPLKYGEGCAHCRGTGLLGRTGIFEVMPLGDRIRRAVMAGSDAGELMKLARQDGMTTLRESAIKKLAMGVTAFEEVVRVTAESW